ncbi:uncharacterized protein LOC126746927 [Anthonomus grandis grandis]|uniref:uncharacterized protein LOC126746927 n=1 Tax=Anthonomus grandis grandis TaxID=2921223 RepID=UPI002164F2DB|nr:uncharacterized protein LOC126746927 [Anthonomus grandis grandis]
MAKSSTLEVDIEFLISLVEARPVLWDKTLSIYKDKNETNKAWRDICVLIKDDFKEMEVAEKNKYGKELIKKWGNIRDAYIKSRKKQAAVSKSGAGVSNVKKYIYNDQLQFMNKIYQERPTSDSILKEGESSQQEISQDGEAHEGENNSDNVGQFKKPEKSVDHENVNWMRLI